MDVAARLRENRGIALLALALAATGAMALWGPRGALDPSPPWGPALLIWLAALAVLYVPLPGPGIGLGAAATAPTALWLGPAAAAIVALLARLARELASPAAAERSRRPHHRLPARLGEVALATLAAVATWRLLWPAGGAAAALTAAGLEAGAIAAAIYLAVHLAAEGGLAAAGGDRVAWSVVLPSLAVDLAGLLIGVLGAAVAVTVGWRAALLLQLVVFALALEAARQLRRRREAEERVESLREATRAGHRIIFRNPDLLGIAEQIHAECGKVLEFEWFQFEILGQKDGASSWCSGPDGVVGEGRAQPPSMPPRLPGIHRRAGWRILEREFGTDDEVIARLTLWCDPRRLEEEALELLDSLLPQMASSVHRALLDRVAKRDPLTDLPDRRAFDSHLERVFDRARREGSPMAVILCDLDSFKRINDMNGHAVGDQALLIVSRLLESQSREEDFCCRLGGDEFAVVLEHADGATGLRTAERIRDAVARRRRADLKTRIPLRVTAGVAGYPELPVRSPAELLELADAAMYEAKRRGKNRCLLHLGRGRFLDPSGVTLGDAELPPTQPPTLFS
ncbi:MAG: GGDEF domain-containing protein [Thermoanaerobaculia bacterium]|nr:GGDEF domain-containing protein [Thermoanaerobaculia bacterium]